MENSIEISSLSTGYKVKHDVKVVARDINASIHSGQLTCLLGPNGAGKSTLLRTLSAFQPPVSGSIKILGKPLAEYSDSELSKVIGVVLTEKVDLRNMTVYDLIGIGRSPYTGFWGTLRDEDRRIVEEAIELVHIEPLRDRMIQTLSDGERQKVMIAKALAQETPIIFLDEPTAFLDYPSKVEIMQLLQQISRERRKTIFLSTHDLELALQIADTIWLMDKEKGLVMGTPEELSVNGSLGEFFSRKGISFDTEIGLFRIENKCDRTAVVTGTPALQPLTAKMLQRYGVKVIDSAPADFIIEATVNAGLPAFTVTMPSGSSRVLNGFNALADILA